MNEPRVLDVRGNLPNTSVLGMAVRHLREGGVVAMPTETVYGFGCVLREDALLQVQRLKERGPGKPFLVLVPDRESVEGLMWTPEARRLAEAFWPGALTLVLPDPRSTFPPGVRSPEGAVALRMSPHPVAKGLVEGLRGPLVSTSANPPGKRPALSAEEAREAVVFLGAGADVWILDGGRLSGPGPSTIIDCTEPEPVVRRAGAIPVHRLRRVVPEIHDPS
jgi:L-threonylcarbamoyladenylate synthase